MRWPSSANSKRTRTRRGRKATMRSTRLTIASQLFLLIGVATLALLLVIAAAVTGSGRMVAAGERLHVHVVAGVEEASRLALLFERQVGLVSRAPAEVDLQQQRGYG